MVDEKQAAALAVDLEAATRSRLGADASAEDVLREALLMCCRTVQAVAPTGRPEAQMGRPIRPDDGGTVN